MPLHSSGTPFERFTRQLVLAWRRLTTYPAGHPIRQGAVGAAHRELAELLTVHNPLILGVSADGLTLGEERIGAFGAGQLAALLHEHNIAILQFYAGIVAEELEVFLEALKPSLQVTEDVSLADELRALAAAHIEIEEADYSSLVVTDTLAGRADERPVNLWDRIIAWHLHGRADPTEQGRGAPLEASGIEAVLDLVERAIEDPSSVTGSAEEASSEAAGSLLEHLALSIRAHLADAPEEGEGGEAPIVEITELIRRLPAALKAPVLDATLEEIVTGGDVEGKAPAPRLQVEGLFSHLSTPSIVASLRRLRARRCRLASPALDLVEQLARLDEKRRTTGAGTPSSETLVPLLLAEDLDAFEGGVGRSGVPADGASTGRSTVPALLALPPPVEPGDAPGGVELDDLVPPRSVERQVRMLLELLSHRHAETPADAVAARLADLFATLMGEDRIGEAASLAMQVRDQLERSPRPEVAGKALEMFSGPATVESLLRSIRAHKGKETREVARLIELLGRPLVQELLDTLAESSDRSIRRLIFDLLAKRRQTVTELAPAMLDDRRWFVVRNIVTLLHSVGDRSSLPRLHRCLRHPDARVRLAALKAIADLEGSLRRATVALLLADSDPRIVRRMIQLSGELGLRSAVGPLLEMLRPVDLTGRHRETRLGALASLGKIGDPAALPELKRFFNTTVPMVSAEEQKAAFRSLAGYPPDARQTLVTRGVNAGSSEVRQICQEILDGGADG